MPAPFYLAELAPPGLRGLMVGMNGVHIALGYSIATYMGLAFSYVDNPSSQWRAPLGLALVWPFLMVLVCFIVPESPRFLLMKGRIEEARKVVFKLHGRKDDPNNEFVRGEFYQMTKQAELDRSLDAGYVGEPLICAIRTVLIVNSSRYSAAPATASELFWPWVLHLLANPPASWS